MMGILRQAQNERSIPVTPPLGQPSPSVYALCPLHVRSEFVVYNVLTDSLARQA